MNSLILQTGSRFLYTLLLLFSIFLLLRGHDQPGGGFIGGLVAASAFALYAIAYDAESARRVLRVSPQKLIGIGLFVAMMSGLFSLLRGYPFLTGLWGDLRLSGEGFLKVGTPFLFDLGVYLVVIGFALLIILSLAEE